MNIIYGEILQGIVDGVNTVFTTQKNISTIIEINIGGLPTTSYTQDGRRIIFDTAPLSGTDNPTIDYYWDELCTFTEDDITVNDILIEVLDNIGITQFSTPYPETTAIRRINEVYKQVKNTDGMDIESTLSFTKGGNYNYGKFERLDLINTTSPIDNYTPRVGRLLLSNSIIEFNTRTDSSFTLTNPTTFTPESNDIILLGYKLPSCVKGVVDVKVNDKTATRIEFNDWNSSATTNLYTINDGYIYFSNYEDVANVVIKYRKNSSKFTVTSDIINIEPEYISALSDYASWKMLQNREDERWQGIQQRWKLELRKWKAYVKRHSKGDNNYQLFDGPLNRI